MNPTVSARALNRCVLTRQRLLERDSTSITAVLEQVGGIQAQYAPSTYVGLWSRLEGFRRVDLDDALASGAVVQGTLMRATIHVVSRADYWPMAIALREPRRQWFLRAHRPSVPEPAMLAAAARARAALAGGPVAHAQLVDVVGRQEMAGLHLFVDIVRVPPSGTWARRRANLYALAEDWVGPEPEITAEAGCDLLVHRYLTAFCPSRPADIAAWAGLTRASVTSALSRLAIRIVDDGVGHELVDLAGATIARGDEPAPVRFLPTWDASLLAHCRSATVIREADRARIFTSANPASEATCLVDGVVEATWRHDDGRIAVTPFAPLPRSARRAVDAEAARLAAWFADASTTVPR